MLLTVWKQLVSTTRRAMGGNFLNIQCFLENISAITFETWVCLFMYSCRSSRLFRLSSFLSFLLLSWSFWLFCRRSAWLSIVSCLRPLSWEIPATLKILSSTLMHPRCSSISSRLSYKYCFFYAFSVTRYILRTYYTLLCLSHLSKWYSVYCFISMSLSSFCLIYCFLSSKGPICPNPSSCLVFSHQCSILSSSIRRFSAITSFKKHLIHLPSPQSLHSFFSILTIWLIFS